jgi:hypothetical protein
MNSTTIKPKNLFVHLLAIAVFISPINLFAQCITAGPFSGSVFSDDNSIGGSFAFSSPGNAAASDNNRASASALLSVFSGNTHYLKATDFNFSIPASAIICGIVVEVEKSASNISLLATVSDNSVQLIKGGTVSGNNYANASTWSTAESYYSYGGSADLWGTTWSPSDINSANFGIAFSASITGLITLLPGARIDHLRITVYYTFIIVPLKLMQFTAKAKDDHYTMLEWMTTNNDEEVSFNIQRSTDNLNWLTLHSQHSEIIQQDKIYQYTDTSYFKKTAFYRLQLQHASGKISYSQIIPVNHAQGSFSIYPNPATSYIFIRQKESARSIQCAGVDGRTWLINYQQVDNDLYKIDISRLPPGSYILSTTEQRRLFTKN